MSLEKRKQIKSRKPDFLAQDVHKKPSIRKRWKRPRGLQSKIRLHKRGYRTGVSQGWRSPKDVRGTSPQGLEVVTVQNVSQLKAIDPKTQGALISAKVSMRTREAIVKAARDQKVTLLNRGADRIEARIEAFKQARDQRRKLRERESAAKAAEAKKVEQAKKTGKLPKESKQDAAATEQVKAEQKTPPKQTEDAPVPKAEEKAAKDEVAKDTQDETAPAGKDKE